MRMQLKCCSRLYLYWKVTVSWRISSLVSANEVRDENQEYRILKNLHSPCFKACAHSLCFWRSESKKHQSVQDPQQVLYTRISRRWCICRGDWATGWAIILKRSKSYEITFRRIAQKPLNKVLAGCSLAPRQAKIGPVYSFWSDWGTF
jgi:hypothetical protein